MQNLTPYIYPNMYKRWLFCIEVVSTRGGRTLMDKCGHIPAGIIIIMQLYVYDIMVLIPPQDVINMTHTDKL